ncbi:MAG: hypothetical protein Q9181_002238 [Wetmoreana brouardii]
MYEFLLGFLIIVSPCFARPAQDEAASQSLSAAGPSIGFPAEYLPIEFSRAANNTLSLILPIDPHTHDELEQTITLSAGIAPRGIELIASIATRIYWNWKDTANLRIRGKIDDRRLPYRNFEFITQPSLQPRAALTPLKVGIVSCWILRACLQAESWPGQVKATVWDATASQRHLLNIGSLEIVNSPLHDAASPSSDSNDFEKELFGGTSLQLSNDTRHAPEPSGDLSAGGISLGIPNHLEKRWVMCWTGFFLLALTFRLPEVVIDSLGLDPHGDRPVMFHCPCAPIAGRPSRDRVDITIFPSWMSGGSPLTWARLVPALLEWITNVAETENAYRVWEAVRDTNPRATYAEMIIDLAAQSDDVAATA